MHMLGQIICDCNESAYLIKLNSNNMVEIKKEDANMKMKKAI